MPHQSPESPPWPTTPEELHELAETWRREVIDQEPLTDMGRTMEEAEATPPPSYYIGSAEGRLKKPLGLSPALDSLLTEELDDIFDEHEAARRRAAIRIASKHSGKIADEIAKRLL